MKMTTTAFKLRAWRHRMGWTQDEAARVVGLSLSAYRNAEYRAQDRLAMPVNATLAKLCEVLEFERSMVPHIFSGVDRYEQVVTAIAGGKCENPMWLAQTALKYGRIER